MAVVLKRDATSGSGAPYREVELVFPQVEGSAFHVVPSFIRHCNVSGDRGILIVSEYVGEVASLIIDLYFLVGQRELLLFGMATGIKQRWLRVHMRKVRCISRLPTSKTANRSISTGAFPFLQARLRAYILSSVVQHLRRVRK